MPRDPRLEAVLAQYTEGQRRQVEALIDALRVEWHEHPPRYWGEGKEVWFPLDGEVQVRFGRYSDHEVMLWTGPGDPRQRAIDLLEQQLGLARADLERQRLDKSVNLRLEQLASATARYRFLAIASALAS
jgi:hypothetical protein